MTPAQAQVIGGRKFAQQIRMRQALFIRYQDGTGHRDQAHLMGYCTDLIVHRLELTHANVGALKNLPRTDDLSLAPLQIDDVATRDALREKAMSEPLSPIDILKILDDSVTSLLDGILAVDYLKLYRESVALLQAISDANGGFEDRVIGAGTKLVLYAKIPTLLAADVKAGKKEVLDIMVSCVERYPAEDHDEQHGDEEEEEEE